MTTATAPKKIIDADKARKKIDRMAYQILEENCEAPRIILMGVANRGHKLAKLIAAKLRRIGDKEIVLTSISVDKRAPLSRPVEIADPKMSFRDETVILIDDVGNTGRTLYYTLLPLAEHLPAKIQAAVLVDRMHKSYPIRVDFVGLELATTLNEEVIVEFDDKHKVEGAYLY